ncbi:hypothetical protein Prudu_004621 [Prunus dulcis]|uniref:Uncharacterized protein n=1 Tax=Prunus dulcis TaxID=3755 RepID=A0A4Y1QVR5_PRUDU|nr:hypothetical protein Prudu_004621 [Prunus dulcis]
METYNLEMFTGALFAAWERRKSEYDPKFHFNSPSSVIKLLKGYMRNFVNTLFLRDTQHRLKKLNNSSAISKLFKLSALEDAEQKQATKASVYILLQLEIKSIVENESENRSENEIERKDGKEE